MNFENAIEVRNVSKSFRIFRDKGYMLKERVIHWSRNIYDDHLVLNNLSFSIKKGESVGLIGKNGCGKSTLLKLLTKIMYPDSGTIKMNGRISSLLELGAGFHPDLSGRENIYINASIFGLTKKEIDARVDDIIHFSELDDYIDNPVRTYSSGMYMRLAFSVAIDVNAEILLIDEILAVGDLNFQEKCFEKLLEIKREGTTIILVSHSLAQIEKMCERSIWIHEGIIKEDGTPGDVHGKYINYLLAQKHKDIEDKEDKIETVEIDNLEEPEEEKNVTVTKAAIYDRDGHTKKTFFVGEALRLEICLTALILVEDYNIEVNLVRDDGLFCYGVSSQTDRIICEAWMGEKKITLSFGELNLLKGKYHFDIHVAKVKGGSLFFMGNVAEFEIESENLERGLIFLKHEWVKE